jgi:uncharacterized protein DUF6249
MEGDWNVMIWALIPIVAIIGVMVTAIVSTINKARIRELQIRERIAMIERGLVPAPELDPHGFDRVMTRIERIDRFRASTPSRHRRAGIIIMGVGFGMMVLLGFVEGTSNEALGVGGFLVVLGLAFFISSLSDRQSLPPESSSSAPPPASPPPQQN